MRAFLLPLVALGGARAQSVSAPTVSLLPSFRAAPEPLDRDFILTSASLPAVFPSRATPADPWLVAQSCDSAQFQAVTLVVNDLCCQGSACSGIPTSCDTTCAPTYLWMYSHCCESPGQLPRFFLKRPLLAAWNVAQLRSNSARPARRTARRKTR